jgi:hypothetical protein
LSIPFHLNSPEKTFDLTNVINHMEFGMAVFSADGSCLFVNDAFAALIHHTPGSPPTDLNFFKLIDNSQLIIEITLALKENHLWYGSQIYP